MIANEDNASGGTRMPALLQLVDVLGFVLSETPCHSTEKTLQRLVLESALPFVPTTTLEGESCGLCGGGVGHCDTAVRRITLQLLMELFEMPSPYRRPGGNTPSSDARCVAWYSVIVYLPRFLTVAWTHAYDQARGCNAVDRRARLHWMEYRLLVHLCLWGNVIEGYVLDTTPLLLRFPLAEIERADDDDTRQCAHVPKPMEDATSSRIGQSILDALERVYESLRESHLCNRHLWGLLQPTSARDAKSLREAGHSENTSTKEAAAAASELILLTHFHSILRRVSDIRSSMVRHSNWACEEGGSSRETNESTEREEEEEEQTSCYANAPSYLLTPASYAKALVPRDEMVRWRAISQQCTQAQCEAMSAAQATLAKVREHLKETFQVHVIGPRLQ